MVDSYQIALIQMYSKMGAVSENVAKAESYIRQAAAHGAVLIMLPEMFHSGVNFNNMREDMNYAEDIDGPTITHMRTLPRELSVYLLCPLVVRLGDGIWENTAYLIDRTGMVLGGYAKTHPVGDERVLLQRVTRNPEDYKEIQSVIHPSETCGPKF